MTIMKKILALLLISAAVAYAATSEEPELITYKAVIEPGETVWGVCAQIASDKDDLSEVVWRACRDSGIKNPGDVKAGTEIIVRVKPLN